MITILMPIYNGIEFINDSVNSILYQSYPHWELLIGVNGHEENSNVYQIAKQYEGDKIKVFDLFHLKGKSITLNHLKVYSKYDFLSLIDVDDIWNLDKLTVQSKYLSKFDVIGTNCIYFGDLPGIIPRLPLGNISAFDFDLYNPIINSSCIIKKNMCTWENNFAEDYTLWKNLREKGKTFYNCEEILVLHRIHQNSFYNSRTR